VRTAADGQELLRRGECDHCCRRQQRTKNAQQHECCNPPHAVSVHSSSDSGHSNSSLRYKTRMQLPPVIAAAVQAGDTVVASSARAARALRRLHAEVQRQQGLQAWQSADILDWDSWLHRLWQKQLRSGRETRLLLTTLQELELWAQVARPTIEGRHLISVHGVAELAQQAYSLLCAYTVLNFLHDDRSGGPDVESFRQWAREFEHRCRQEGWLSRAKLPLVLQEAVLAGQVEATARLLLIGFDRVTPAQQQLIEAFRDRGYDVQLVESSEVSASETTLLVEAIDKRDEIATCALWIKQELATRDAARFAVVVPNVSTVRPEIERVFREILAPQTVAIGEHDKPLPFEFSLGVPLADVPMARSALLLLRWMKEALSLEQLSWLLLSGFLHQQQDELLPIAEFDVKFRRQAMRQPEQDLETFLYSANPPDNLRRSLQAGRRMLTQNGSLNFAEWVNVAERILAAVHWPGAHPLQSEDFQVQARWSQLLDSVAALAFDGRRAGYSEFLEVLERQARQTIFASESRDAPVQIMGPFEAAGLTFDALWFIGADDASWPAVARRHPFLPRSLQQTHNMPHADSTADWKLAQQVTGRLERSAAKCVFSYPSQNADGVCRPSTLLNAVKQKTEAKALRISIGADEHLPGSEFPPLLEEQENAAILPWPLEQNAGGAEILRRQAACPFQSFATRRLDARPMDATDWGLEARDRGSVVHKILEDLWTELKTRYALLQARAEARLHALVERHVSATLQRYRGRAPKDRWTQAYLDAEQKRIVSLIEEWLDYEAKRADFTVEAGEEKLGAAVGDLKLQVRVDRIDAIAGGRVIIDYKTGLLNGVSWDGPRPDEPQLPLYAGFGQIEHLKGVLLGRVREEKVKFIGRVEDAATVMPGDVKLTKPPYSADMLRGWQNVLSDLGQQFLRGEAQIDPKQYPKTCKFCDLPGLCRIAESDRAAAGDDADESDD
jgi:ATP-dependent helicase/nuclease subunit B